MQDFFYVYEPGSMQQEHAFARIVYYAVLITLNLGSNGIETFSKFLKMYREGEACSWMYNEYDKIHESKAMVHSIQRSIAAIFGEKLCSGST